MRELATAPPACRLARGPAGRPPRCAPEPLDTPFLPHRLSLAFLHHGRRSRCHLAGLAAPTVDLAPYYRVLHHQRMTQPTGHPVAATERPLGPPLKPHPGAAPRIPEHREKQQTCKTYWRTRQGKQDRSTDRVGASLHVTITVMPDTANPVGPNTTDKAHLSYIVI